MVRCKKLNMYLLKASYQVDMKIAKKSLFSKKLHIKINPDKVTEILK